jgi:hypothetical protein
VIVKPAAKDPVGEMLSSKTHFAYYNKPRVIEGLGNGEPSSVFKRIVALCAVLVASPSWAAIVEPVYGDLSISHGQGFKPVNGRINAGVGDSVMVGPGGAATSLMTMGAR